MPETKQTQREQSKAQAELASFQDLWHGGFCEGNPSDPTFGLWGVSSYLGVSHAVYLACLKPYVKPSTVVLEIGCGRGAWSKLMLDAEHLYCLDALSAEHNGFYEYVGRHPNVTYNRVQDFALAGIPLDSIDFTFSYDALCHVSFGGISEYAQNLFPRMRAGGHGVWMVADYEKYNAFIRNQDQYCVLNGLMPRERYKFLRSLFGWIATRVTRWNSKRYGLHALDIHGDDTPRPGRWYHAGTARTCEMLESKGFTVVDADMGFDVRSPIIHFRK